MAIGIPTKENRYSYVVESFKALPEGERFSLAQLTGMMRLSPTAIKSHLKRYDGGLGRVMIEIEGPNTKMYSRPREKVDAEI